MKYLVVKCTELGDQWECDADREPICLTNDFAKFDKYGYEIYEITSGNTFKLVKKYDTSSEEGVAIYKWHNADEFDEDDEPDEIIAIFKNHTRDMYTKSKIKQIKSEYHFEDSIDDIYNDMRCSGVHAEEINGEWVVIGEYVAGFGWNQGV